MAPEIPFLSGAREPRQALRGRSGRWIVPDGKVAQDCLHYCCIEEAVHACVKARQKKECRERGGEITTGAGIQKGL